MPQDPAKAHNGPIFWAIIITIFFSFFMPSLFLSSQDRSSAGLWIIPVYWVAHVIIGRVVMSQPLSRACVVPLMLYTSWTKRTDGGKWAADSRLIFASLWPLSGAVMLPVTLIGVLFGLLFKRLF